MRTGGSTRSCAGLCRLRVSRRAAKFVEYVRADSEMAPHVDLSKPAAECLDGTVAATTHTRVLYLRTCANGATAMLSDVRAGPPCSTRVRPERGARCWCSPTASRTRAGRRAADGPEADRAGLRLWMVFSHVLPF